MVIFIFLNHFDEISAPCVMAVRRETALKTLQIS